jgi:uncharacterized protein (DUF302 family)
MTTTTMTAYGMKKTVALPYEKAVEKVRVALKDQGFGVLTEIDIKAKLKEKIGVDFKRYMILGACNPPLAHKALLAEPDLGLLLPCNVIIYEVTDDESVVAAADPEAMMQVTGNDTLRTIAEDAKGRLKAALANV